MADETQDYATTIGADAVFKGELHFEKGLNVLGKFEGEINSKGNLLVAEGALLRGDVKAGTIRIDGQVRGNLTASTKVLLSASASIEGDLTAARLEVAEGAVIVGRCTIGVNGQNKTAGPIKTAPAGSVTPAKGSGVAATSIKK